jgi:hypothetical protein
LRTGEVVRAYAIRPYARNTAARFAAACLAT